MRTVQMDAYKMNRKNVCIIGAGAGSLAVGALLVQRGCKVKIYERETVLGGRALSVNTGALGFEEYTNLLSRFDMHIPFAEPALETIFEEQMLKDYVLDLGFHAIGGAQKSVLGRVLAKLGENVDIIGSRVGYIYDQGLKFPFLSTFDKLRMLPRIVQLLYSKESTMRSLDSVSMAETIKKYGRERMTLALELFSRTITTVNDLNRISTGETFRSQANLLRGAHPVGYPVNGLQSISQAFADFIAKNGGEIVRGTTVDEIIIEDDAAKGVVAGSDDQYFDAVISSVPVQDMFSIVEEKYFPSMYVKKIKKLEGTGSLCAYYSLKKVDSNLVRKSFIFIERDVDIEGGAAVGMIDFKLADPSMGMAPKDRYLIQAYIICSPREAKNEKKLEVLKNILDKWMEKIIPNFHADLEWTIYPTTWHLDGVAKTIDNEKPSCITPIKNFYLVGDCVKSIGVGMNCAVDSSIKLFKILNERKAAFSDF
jgi:protoporphyrinogen oxidase